MLINEETRNEGSNCPALRQGTLTRTAAVEILLNTRYVPPSEIENDDAAAAADEGVCAAHWLRDTLENDFPGVDLVEHIGTDISAFTGNIITLVTKSAMYQTLKLLYHRTINNNVEPTFRPDLCLPVHVTVTYLCVCFHVCGCLGLNPNITWSLISENLVKDALILLL